MKRFPAIIILLIIAFVLMVFPMPGFSVTDKVVLHIEGMT